MLQVAVTNAGFQTLDLKQVPVTERRNIASIQPLHLSLSCRVDQTKHKMQHSQVLVLLHATVNSLYKDTLYNIILLQGPNIRGQGQCCPCTSTSYKMLVTKAVAI